MLGVEAGRTASGQAPAAGLYKNQAIHPLTGTIPARSETRDSCFPASHLCECCGGSVRSALFRDGASRCMMSPKRRVETTGSVIFLIPPTGGGLATMVSGALHAGMDRAVVAIARCLAGGRGPCTTGRWES
jgi:hypothetical protein